MFRMARTTWHCGNGTHFRPTSQTLVDSSNIFFKSALSYAGRGGKMDCRCGICGVCVLASGILVNGSIDYLICTSDVG